jgi:hypothetical protein
VPRFFTRSFAALCVVFFSVVPHSSALAADTPPTTSVAQSTQTTQYGYDLENDPSLCINSNPRPNCGRKATQAGDRGGALQYVLFAILIAAIAFIGVVIGRNVVKRDRALGERVNDAPTNTN